MAYITITKDNFTDEVLNSKKTVLLDFWATWCGPCRMIAPIVEEIAEENDDIVVGKINVDDERELSKQFGIMSIPQVYLFKDGEVIGKTGGYQDINGIKHFIEDSTK